MSTSSPRSILRAIARRAMIDRGLLPDFSPRTLAEVDALSPADSASVGKGVRDLRALAWTSIDNDDSRDLDQLSVCAPAAGAGPMKVLVAIADVDSLVKKDSAIDTHARANTTTVYTGAEIFPMLPERLSTDLTSLNPHEDRLAIVVEMVVDDQGAVIGSDVTQALVRNQAKLAYASVAAWLDGDGPVPEPMMRVPGLEDQIRMQDRVAQRLKAARHQHGALDLQTIEARAVFDGDAIGDLRADPQNRAKDLIEDFMIAVNGVTARYLAAKNVASLRRVVRSPERWQRIVSLAREYGGELPEQPDSRALERFLVVRKAADPVRFADLSLAVVKLMGAGEYVAEVPGGDTSGHFGLAVKDYMHATAPNRRYPDLITQRLLKAVLAARPVPYTRDDLEALATHCTKKEDDANKVERLVRKAAGALLLANRLGDQFDAIVTGASAKGTWVRVFQPPVEGKLERGFEGLDVGDRVRVRLIGTDPQRGFIDFAASHVGGGR